MSTAILQIKTATAAAPHPIGGTTTPAPEASVAGISPVGNYPAQVAAVPACAGAFSEEKDARLARLREGHARRFAWSPEKIAAIKALVADAVDVNNIAKRLSINPKTLRSRAPLLGIDLIGEAKRREEAGDAVLRRLYRTDAEISDIHAKWVEAIGEDRSRIAMRSRARRLDLRRDAETPLGRMMRANRARMANVGTARQQKAAAIQEAVDAGATRNEIMSTLRVAKETLRKMVADGLVTFPPKPPKPVVVKAPKPPRPVVVKAPKVAAPKPAKMRQVPPPVVLHAERKPEPPRVVFQTVDEYLAAGGKITRCPTVALLATQATVPASDTEAVRAYYDAKPTGNWRAQRVAERKKAKREGRA